MQSFLAILRRLQPTTRFGKFSAFVVVGYILLKLLGSLFHSSVLSLLGVLLGGALLIVVIRYVFRATRWLVQKLLWRLRRRLLVTYALIGIVPVFLLFSILLISSYLVFGHLASFFVDDGIDHLSTHLETATRALLIPMLDPLSHTARPDAENWSKILAPMLESLGSRFSQVWLDAQSGDHYVALEYRDGRLSPRSGGGAKPAWLRGDTTGIFVDPSKPFLASFVVRTAPGAPGWLLLRAPLDDSAFRFISKYTFVSIRLRRLVPVPKESPSPEDVDFEIGGVPYRAGPLTSPAEPDYTRPLAWYDFPISFPTRLLNLRVWQTGAPPDQPMTQYFMVVDSTWVRLAKRLFSVGFGGDTNPSLLLLWIVSVVFLTIELVALISAILMTRTITGAIHHLDRGAQHLLRGDFSYRIPVKVRDQLSSLAATFNSMATALERLLKEEAEKQRLDSELAVAREVQQHLFPSEVPRLARLQVAGTCRPARVVSGDYYDYLIITPSTLGLALADVSGKGVSAALLMASLQAALHSHLAIIGSPMASAAMERYAHERVSSAVASSQVAEIVSLLNQQLYQNTPIEKYATFFYAIYDEPSARLTYTNAGHLPPLVVTAHGVRRLETGGTVVGLFPDIEYEQDEVRLAPGDVLVAYTDGITEAENPQGEQFGEQRLIDLVVRVRTKPADRIMADILRAVGDWIGSAEPQDDITLIVTKATGLTG